VGAQCADFGFQFFDAPFQRLGAGFCGGAALGFGAQVVEDALEAFLGAVLALERGGELGPVAFGFGFEALLEGVGAVVELAEVGAHLVEFFAGLGAVGFGDCLGLAGGGDLLAGLLLGGVELGLQLLDLVAGGFDLVLGLSGGVFGGLGGAAGGFGQGFGGAAAAFFLDAFVVGAGDLFVG
jgi:hypothetical protein